MEGPRATVTPDLAALKKSTEDQTAAVLLLSERAGIHGEPASQGDWYRVLKAGMEFSDDQCVSFIEDLFEYDRANRAASRGTAIAGSTTAGIMGATEATAKAIAVTASLFGLASEAIAISGEAVLYKVKPSVIRTLVEKAQQAYRDGVEANQAKYDNRADVMLAWGGYHRLCLPTFIEAQIEDAATQSDFRPIETNSAIPDIQRIGGQTGLNASQLEEYKQGERILTAVEPPPPLPEAKRVSGCAGDECYLNRDQARRIQRTLCTSTDGEFGATTREAIGYYQTATTPEAQATKTLSARQITSLLLLGTPCDQTNAPDGPFRNAYERFSFGDPATGYTSVIVDRVKGLQARLGIGPEGQSGKLDDTLRQLLKGKTESQSEEITPEVLRELE